jgi:two-component system phosphate regulon sensor histidine kinase PhoR
MDDTPKTMPDIELAYAQALKYGQDLARVYNQEKEKRRELEIANQKLNAILATAPNGLAVLDEHMRIKETNPRFEALVELKGQCIGHPLIEVLPSDQLSAALEVAARQAAPFAEVEVSLAQPMARTLQVTGAPLAAGGERGWVVSLHDLTERKRLEGLKEEFIDIAAHELRTPLAIILGFASVLTEDVGSSNPAAAAPIDAIVRAANRLKMVINELVEFVAAKSRSSAEGEANRFDLWDVVNHAVSALAYQANHDRIDIVVHAIEEPLIVAGDRVIIAQAIEHLLENAIKFNRPGGRVTVRASQTNGETILEIEDTGIGIPASELDKIFDMFYQVEEHMTRARGGLGMGLSIARRGIELHGGRIELTTMLGRGSCFRVTLPSAAEQVFISPQSRLDTAHQQTLAYGHDLARTFMTQQMMAQQLSQVSHTAQQLLDCLERSFVMETPAIRDNLLEQARALAQRVLEDADFRSERGQEKAHE